MIHGSKQCELYLNWAICSSLQKQWASAWTIKEIEKRVCRFFFAFCSYWKIKNIFFSFQLFSCETIFIQDLRFVYHRLSAHLRMIYPFFSNCLPHKYLLSVWDRTTLIHHTLLRLSFCALGHGLFKINFVISSACNFCNAPTEDATLCLLLRGMRRQTTL